MKSGCSPSPPLFGLGFAGIIPAYILAIRELFPASEAYWRIPTFLLCSGTGMALGGSLAGVLYDHFGTYAPAFAAGVAANAVNLAIVGRWCFVSDTGRARCFLTAPPRSFNVAANAARSGGVAAVRASRKRNVSLFGTIAGDADAATVRCRLRHGLCRGGDRRRHLRSSSAQTAGAALPTALTLKPGTLVVASAYPDPPFDLDRERHRRVVSTSS